MKRRILLDLFCGRGGWTVPALSAGWECIGFDIADHGYPGRLVLGSLPCSIDYLKSFQPDLIVASPPCEDFARHHLPWIAGPVPSTDLLRWSIGLVGKFDCRVIVECSRFAARHVTTPRAFLVGSYALWGNYPALLPDPPRRKSRYWGTDPAKRAMIEPCLAEWIIASNDAGRNREACS
jgi:hypothetical protein